MCVSAWPSNGIRYYGGPAGTVFHIDGVCEYADDQRERLTNSERARVLERVIKNAKELRDIELEIQRD